MSPTLGLGRNSSKRRELTRSLGENKTLRVRRKERQNKQVKHSIGGGNAFPGGDVIGEDVQDRTLVRVSKLDLKQNQVQSCQHRTKALPAGKTRAMQSKQEQWFLFSWKGAFKSYSGWAEWPGLCQAQKTWTAVLSQGNYMRLSAFGLIQKTHPVFALASHAYICSWNIDGRKHNPLESYRESTPH